MIKDFPSTDVEPVKHGTWIWFYRRLFTDFYRCSICGKTVTDYYAYCPHCGAKMDKK